MYESTCSMLLVLHSAYLVPDGDQAGVVAQSKVLAVVGPATAAHARGGTTLSH